MSSLSLNEREAAAFQKTVVKLSIAIEEARANGLSLVFKRGVENRVGVVRVIGHEDFKDLEFAQRIAKSFDSSLGKKSLTRIASRAINYAAARTHLPEEASSGIENQDAFSHLIQSSRDKPSREDDESNVGSAAILLFDLSV